MGTIYQKDGQSLYDINGVTYDARTGQTVTAPAYTNTNLSSPLVYPTTPTNSPSVVSARQANEQIQTAVGDYQNIQRQQQTTTAQKTADAAAKPPVEQQEEPLTLAYQDPNTGGIRQATIYSPSINRSQIQDLISAGWEAVSGTIPQGVGPNTTVQQVQADDEYQGFMKELDTMRSNMSAANQAYIDSIKASYETRKRQMEDVNMRERASLNAFGISSGASRYSASFSGIISEAERQGISRLSELDAEEKSLIAQAQQAYTANDFKVLSQKINLYNDNQTKKQKAMEELQKAALEQNKLVQQKADEARKKQEQASRDGAIASLFTQGIKSPTELLSMLNYDDAGNQIGDFTLEEIKAGLDRITPKDDKLPSGEYGEFVQLKQSGEIPAEMKWFEYLKQKGNASRAPTAPGEGIVGGAVSGVVARDADTIMAGGGLRLDDLPTKNNYRGTVAAELAKRKEQARASGDTIGIIRASAGGKPTSDTFNQSFEKAVNVVYQLADLQEAIKGQATGPIWGTIRSNNPYDVKSQQIKAQLQAIVPNLARGIYGEVGVLTDADIANYTKTLPKLTNPEAVRNAILGITMKSVQRSLENKIRINANQDITHVEDIYQEVKAVADKYLAPLEAQTLKEELERETLAGNSATSTTDNASFWGNAK